jgi:hypothetical protein
MPIQVRQSAKVRRNFATEEYKPKTHARTEGVRIYLVAFNYRDFSNLQVTLVAKILLAKFA